MSPATKKVAIYYGVWVLFCMLWALTGFGDSKAAHLYLALTGLPLALLSLHIIPNGTLIATFAAGLIGLLQWCLVAEANAKWGELRKSKNTKT